MSNNPGVQRGKDVIGDKTRSGTHAWGCEQREKIARKEAGKPSPVLGAASAQSRERAWLCDAHILGLTAKSEDRACPSPSHPALVPPPFPTPQRPWESSSNYPGQAIMAESLGIECAKKKGHRGSSESPVLATGYLKLAPHYGNWGSKENGVCGSHGR